VSKLVKGLIDARQLLIEKRCASCSRKLMNAKLEMAYIEIKCAKCGYVNVIQGKQQMVTKMNNTVIVKGSDFEVQPISLAACLKKAELNQSLCEEEMNHIKEMKEKLDGFFKPQSDDGAEEYTKMCEELLNKS
jgi:phage FluMu protein Com